MIKAVLPGMRQRRRGHIINITSMGSFITLPGISYYCGSKFALEGISETLSKELAPFNLHVTAVAPGSFRTDWAGRSMVRSPRCLPDYDALFEPVRQARQEKRQATGRSREGGSRHAGIDREPEPTHASVVRQ